MDEPKVRLRIWFTGSCLPSMSEALDLMPVTETGAGDESKWRSCWVCLGKDGVLKLRRFHSVPWCHLSIGST